MNTRFLRTYIGLFAFLAAYGTPVLCQIDRSAYRPSTIGEIIAKHGLREDSTRAPSHGTNLIAPKYKYRLRVKATGRIRHITSDMAVALLAYSQINPDLPAFLNNYTHAVEVKVDGKSIWLMWQRSLITPFLDERGNGGEMEVYAVLGGTFRGELLLFVTAFESIGVASNNECATSRSERCRPVLFRVVSLSDKLPVW